MRNQSPGFFAGRLPDLLQPLRGFVAIRRGLLGTFPGNGSERSGFFVILSAAERSLALTFSRRAPRGENLCAAHAPKRDFSTEFILAARTSAAEGLEMTRLITNPDAGRSSSHSADRTVVSMFRRTRCRSFVSARELRNRGIRRYTEAVAVSSEAVPIVFPQAWRP